MLCDLNEQPLGLMHRSGFLATLGEANVARTLDDALQACQAGGDEPAQAVPA